MFSFLGFNFNGDKNALDHAPTNINDITKVQLQNGVFDHYTLTRDVQSPYSSEKKPWDFLTLMEADFNNNINAGNTDLILSQISSIKIKRRIKGDFNWMTLGEFPINKIEDLKFNFKDLYNANGMEYEYALVPIINQIEGNYIINSVESKFNGVFVCDYETIYKFYVGVGYGEMDSVQSVGVYETIGGKYPIVVSNGDINYKKGSIRATILNQNYEDTRVLDRQATVKARELVDKFFKNKRAKILKDDNGNIWLIYFTSNIQTSFRNDLHMGIADISAEWTEQGDPNDQEDLYVNGLLDRLE